MQRRIERTLEWIDVKREIARALSTLLLACAVACANDDESEPPWDTDVGAALDAESEPPHPQQDAEGEPPRQRDGATAEPLQDAGTAPTRDAAVDGGTAAESRMDAAFGKLDAALEAGMALDAGHHLDSGTPARDAHGESSDAKQPNAPDAASDAAPASGGMDATTTLDAAHADASETGGADADVINDASSSDAAPSVERATFTRVYTLLRQRCRSCHQPGATYSLDFSTKQIAYDELVGGPNMGAAEFIVCSGFGYRRVVPGDPDASLLVQKLEATQPCGDRMPPGAMPDFALSDEVRRWIAAGALND